VTRQTNVRKTCLTKNEETTLPVFGDDFTVNKHLFMFG